MTKQAPADPLPRTAPHTGRTVLMVLGMHRSGTSALAGVLARLGSDLPQTEMPATKSNERGFYESDAIYRLNNEILESVGIDWRDWQPFPDAWLQSHKALEFHDRARTVLQEEFGTSGFFVMKDPRICRLFAFWKPVLEAEEVTPAIIHTHRNPLEVAASLTSRNKLPEGVGLLIWLRHVLDAEAATRGMPRQFTSFERLLESWQREIRRFEEKLNLVFPRQSLKSAEEVTEFLSNDLKHFNLAPATTLENPQLSVWIRDTFEILTRWAKSGELSDDHKRLDKINAAFSSTAPVFGALLSPQPADTSKAPDTELRNVRKKLAAQTARAAELQADLDDFAEAEEALKATIETSQETEATLRQSLAETNDLLAAETERSQQMALELDQSNSDKKAAEEALQQTESALRQRQVETDELQAEIDTLRTTLDEARADLAAAADMQPRLEATEAALAQSNLALETQIASNASLLADQQQRYEELGRLVSLMAKLEANQAEAQTAFGKKQAEAQARIKTLSTDLDQARQKLDWLRKGRDTAREELDEIRKTRDEAQKERDAARQEQDKLRQERNRIQAERDTARKERDETLKTRDEVQKERDEIRTNHDKARKERDDLTKALRAMQTSTSWKITKPLRRVIRFVRRH